MENFVFHLLTTVLKWDYDVANNNQMVLARKVPIGQTTADIVERFYGQLYDAIIDGRKYSAPPECDPRYTVQVGNYPIFLDGSKLPNGLLYPGKRKINAHF